MWHYILIILKKINQKVLLPTRDALHLIQKAYHKSLFWKWANISKSIIPEPTEFGWEMSQLTDIQRLKTILMTNDGTRNDKLKLISCNCTTDYKMNCCGCKEYHVHYIVENMLKEMTYVVRMSQIHSTMLSRKSVYISNFIQFNN